MLSTSTATKNSRTVLRKREREELCFCGYVFHSGSFRDEIK
jgi:hypothetical protein